MVVAQVVLRSTKPNAPGACRNGAPYAVTRNYQGHVWCSNSPANGRRYARRLRGVTSVCWGHRGGTWSGGWDWKSADPAYAETLVAVALLYPNTTAQAVSQPGMN